MTAKTKIAVIGAGQVGSTSAFALMMSDLSLEIALIDVDRKKAAGDALDIMHGAAFLPSSEIHAGDYADCQGADIVVITAGARQRPGESRIDLLKRNYAIFKDIIENLRKNADPEPILLVVSNPVDILTYMTYRLAGLPKNRVLGSGTVLDSSRFKYLLGRRIKIDPKSLHAYIIGEHGDSEVTAWSKTSIAGMRFDDYFKTRPDFDPGLKDKLRDQVRNAAYEVIELKGATYYAIALSVRRIVECILRDDRSLLPVSCVLGGEYGLPDIALSLPAVVGRNGVEEIVPIEYDAEELERLRRSAEALQKSWQAVEET